MEQLDAIDREILRILQRDARSSNQKLAREVGLSPSPCWRRVRRLEERGIIRRYVTLLAPEALGLHVQAFAQVCLEEHNHPMHAHFEAVVRDQPEVLECHATSGSYDYLLKIVCSSIASYENFLNRRLLALQGVRSINTSFVLQQKKVSTELPLPDGPSIEFGPATPTAVEDTEQLHVERPSPRPSFGPVDPAADPLPLAQRSV